MPFNVGALLAKLVSITGTALRPRPLDEKIAITQRFAEEVLPWSDNGHLKPVIDRRYNFADIADAHTFMASNGNVGKIVVRIAD